MFEVIDPVSPNASPEAMRLLRFLYSIAGKKTLAGQHDFLGRMSVVTDKVKEITGRYPAVWGSDFGFSDERHDIDNIKYRVRLVDEIKKQYSSGAIITMTYHQANPVIGEPCLFQGGVISKLTDPQWEDLITLGTEIHGAWQKQMEIVAGILKKVEEAHIPVLFRPYHEMNGDWFWWGGRKGPDGYIALYKQLFHYFTEHHRLDNLLWVWSPDKPWPGVEDFYPGDDYVDILGADIYPMKDKDAEVYPQEWYDRMVGLAKNRPLALTEFCVLPSEETLERQPSWVWMMAWADLLLRSNTKETIIRFFDSQRTLTREELPQYMK